METDHTIEKHIKNLEAAAGMLRRVGTGGASEQEQALLDLRAIISALTRANEFERWARRIVRDALDEMQDDDMAAAAATRQRGGRRR